MKLLLAIIFCLSLGCWGMAKRADSLNKNKPMAVEKNSYKILPGKIIPRGLDSQFIDFWSHLRSDYQKREECLFKRDIYTYIDQSNLNVLKIDVYSLEKFTDYSELLNPESTGVLTVTFWKTPRGEYFFRISGGCFAFEDKLYGPFVEENGKFKLKK